VIVCSRGLVPPLGEQAGPHPPGGRELRLCRSMRSRRGICRAVQGAEARGGVLFSGRSAATATARAEVRLHEEQRQVTSALCLAAPSVTATCWPPASPRNMPGASFPFDYRQHFVVQFHPAGVAALSRSARQARCPAGNSPALRPDLAPFETLGAGIAAWVRRKSRLHQSPPAP